MVRGRAWISGGARRPSRGGPCLACSADCADSARVPPRVQDRFLADCSAIVHVGANLGQERELAERHGLVVFWVEPIPLIYDRLVKTLHRFPGKRQFGLCSRTGPEKRWFSNIANNEGASSSIYDLAMHKDIWPTVQYVERMEALTETLDGLVELGEVLLPVDGIVLDTQGSELLVLKGAERTLSQTRYVKGRSGSLRVVSGRSDRGHDPRLSRAKVVSSAVEDGIRQSPVGGGGTTTSCSRSARRRAGAEWAPDETAEGSCRGGCKASFWRFYLGVYDSYWHPERRSGWADPLAARDVGEMHLQRSFRGCCPRRSSRPEHIVGIRLSILPRSDVRHSLSRGTHGRTVLLARGYGAIEMCGWHWGTAGSCCRSYCEDLPLAGELEKLFGRRGGDPEMGGCCPGVRSGALRCAH